MLIYSHGSSTEFSNYCEVCDKTSRSGSTVLKESKQVLRTNKNAHRDNFVKEHITISSHGSYSD